jgi:sulfur-carrier protein
MAVVTLRAPLRDLAGGNSQIAVDGASVGEALRTLERLHPRIEGWILDEQGRIRAHVNVFVNGERTKEDAPLEQDDRMDVLHSISGGSWT